MPSESGTFPTFAESLPMRLMRARDMSLHYFRPVFAQKDLTEQQWRVLRALYDEDGLDISSLAERCRILMPSLSGIIKRLETRGLIERSVNQDDQRSFVVSLSAKARGFIEELAPQIEKSYETIQQKVGHGELEQLYALLAELERKLGDNVP